MNTSIQTSVRYDDISIGDKRDNKSMCYCDW